MLIKAFAVSARTEGIPGVQNVLPGLRRKFHDWINK